MESGDNGRGKPGKPKIEILFVLCVCARALLRCCCCASDLDDVPNMRFSPWAKIVGQVKTPFLGKRYKAYKRTSIAFLFCSLQLLITTRRCNPFSFFLFYILPLIDFSCHENHCCHPCCCCFISLVSTCSRRYAKHPCWRLSWCLLLLRPKCL